MGAHQTMIWYLVTIRDALALITRAGTYNARANTHSPSAHINPDSSYRYLPVLLLLHKCLSAYNRTDVHLRISYEYFISPVESARRPVASSEYTLLNSNSNIELDYNGCLSASFRCFNKKTKRGKKARRSDDLVLTYRALKNCVRKNARALTASNSTALQ